MKRYGPTASRSYVRRHYGLVLMFAHLDYIFVRETGSLRGLGALRGDKDEHERIATLGLIITKVQPYLAGFSRRLNKFGTAVMEIEKLWEPSEPQLFPELCAISYNR